MSALGSTLGYTLANLGAWTANPEAFPAVTWAAAAGRLVGLDGLPAAGFVNPFAACCSPPWTWRAACSS